MSRTTLDPYLVQRLLAERGGEPFTAATVRACWDATGSDELGEGRDPADPSRSRALRIRRGVVGRYFDRDRVLLCWRPRSSPDEGDPFSSLVTIAQADWGRQ